MNNTTNTPVFSRRLGRALTCLAVATSLAVAGCSPGSSDSAPDSQTSSASAQDTSSTRSTETVTSSTTLPAEYDTDDREPVNEDPGIKPLGKLSAAERTSDEEWGSGTGKVLPTAVRVGRHKGFDRVVIDLDAEGDSTPGWYAAYKAEPRQQASGHIIEVAGDTYLNVDLTGTAYPMEFGEEFDPLDWKNSSGKGIVQEVKDAGTFEARTQFVIGLSGAQRPFSVTVLKNPQRVVIDIAHDA
ncbi:hypothetical protein CCICO_09415 [Corynebacterium ciconiae DSM 44920]|uniref:AMIN-like domain-containing (lipo)protein n=1 Tax=Corynebacterium ciconiae TaxID=227319 RepID=UPI0003742933|nr:hypothetical protein [Corynebacterium ciconiae]WKD61891.1 hypothetical protein CCICO_09415 [Corynebacterium ciconiae DSM 44920]